MEPPGHRPDVPIADRVPVDVDDAQHLSQRPRQKDLVGLEQILDQDRRHLDRNALAGRNFDDFPAGNPRQNAVGIVGRPQRPVLDQKNVRTGAFPDLALLGDEHRLVAVVPARLFAHQDFRQ